MDNLIWLDPGLCVNKNDIIKIQLRELDKIERVQWHITMRGCEEQKFGPVHKDIYKAKEWLKIIGIE